MSEEFNSIAFDLPKNKSNVIKVIGVGGGGSNAIKHMYQQGIKGVDFVICNTDSQALDNSPVPNKIQLGVTLTEGLGAGANPEVGEHAAKESIEDVRALLDSNTKMVFITAGMGGGTGTGAAPVIAQIARDMDILTVGIVTTPFQFEGKVRNEQAQKGIEKFRSSVDSLIIINNNKLRDVYGNLGFKAGFSKADEVLATASRGIAEVITNHYTQNIDLRDAKTVLANSGTAIMGSAQSTGSNRAQEGILKALDSPLLNDNKISGAKNVLLLIVSGTEEITIDEIGEVNEHIQNEAGGVANIIMGVGEDEALGDAISITVIATGFDVEQQNEISNTEAKRIIHTLEEEQRATAILDEANSDIVAGELIMDLEEEVVEDIAFAEAEPEPIPVPAEPEKPLVIVHELGEEEPEEAAIPVVEENVLIPTTEFINNLNVVYEEVLDQTQDFVIKEVSAEKVETEEQMVIKEEIEVKEEDEDQFFLDFDMPLSAQLKEEEQTPPAKKYHQLEDIEVNEPINVVPVNDDTKEGVTVYSLEDYAEEEERLNNAKPQHRIEEKEVVVEPEPEIKIVSKTAPVTPQESKTEILDKDVDPTDLPLNEVLVQRAEERKRKMHAYNYKFKNSHRLDEIEKQPAYLRQGVELDKLPKEGERSRTTLSTDENNEIQFRSNNNSFLHDNVD
ncbi:cell division protein FtsZ [Nonlabens xylanidelens]|uniref:Cell division protein FtsZ n=1 Tax=Nonlabens xylanidelens TaxID=191564 RepID=A0A2S6IJT3_9FLAO|nr:cell division protein FtsZ [Nonlabens xylanidelens]PPK94441.1 cell division protein FtsZ [Nonlabens xylanidelens]PQJ21400.1 cell division protein FtsZ [Nonlabens xylanidelens]